MYTDRVSEVMDSIIFEEQYHSRKDARTEGIRRLLEEQLPKASAGHKNYCSPEIPMMVIEQIKKYFDPNADVYDILGFYDDTLFGQGSEGILFCKEGIFIREMWARPYYLAYTQIISRASIASKKEMILCLSGGDTENVIMSCDREAMGTLIRQIVELYKRMEERKDS